jgi:DNA polymerase elongation subunit (family B)
LIKNEEIGTENVLVVYLNSYESVRSLRFILNRSLSLDLPSRTVTARGELMMGEFEPTDKLLSQLDLGHCQWISYTATIPSEENKISILEHEYIVDIPSVVAVPDEEAKSLSTNPWVFSFDIECNTPNHKKFPDLWDVNCPIEVISCSLARADGTDGKTWSLIVGTEETEAALQDYKREGNTIVFCEHEIDLILKTCELIQIYDPEILTGFNLPFDIEYMNARFVSNLVPWPYISRLKQSVGGKERTIDVKVEIWDSSAYRNMKIAHFLGMHGRIVMDVYLEVYRNNRFPSYKLNYVANYYLGVGKIPLPYSEMFRLLDVHNLGLDAPVGSQAQLEGIEAIKKVIEYCDEDSNLCTRLFARLKMWINSIECSNIMCVNMYALNTRGQQSRCIQMLYREAMKDGYFIDKKLMTEIPFEGGKVQDPVSGNHNEVLTIDFNSLYPSIIQAHNVCYTTKILPALYDRIPVDACHVQSVECTSNVNPNKEDGDFKQPQRINGELGTYEFRWLKSEYREGLLPRMAKRLCVKRKLVQAEMKACTDPEYKEILDKRQNAYKVACNSIYGFTGAAKLPLREAAVAVTAWGRGYITRTSEYIQSEWGAYQIYGDTDSLMFCTPGHVKTPADCARIIEIICNEITTLFPDDIIMKPEYCGKMLSVMKKKYITWIYKADGTYEYSTEASSIADTILEKIFHSLPDRHNVPREKIFNVILDYVATLSSHINIADGVLANRINELLNLGEQRLTWTDVDILVIPYIKKSIRGVLSARRDNCKWASQTYDYLIEYIMAGAGFRETILFITSRIKLIAEGDISYKQLLINKAINASYKQKNASMKLFGDRMRALGKVIEAGERLNYIVVETEEKSYLGDCMVLEDVYLESLDTETPYKIDYVYYIDRTVRKQMDKLLLIAYQKELFKHAKTLYYQSGRSLINILTPIGMLVKMLACGETVEDFLALVMKEL